MSTEQRILFKLKKGKVINMKNIFDRPCYHIEQIKKVKIDSAKRKKFNSKSMLCAWVTKLCPAHCKSCFFKSDMYHEGIPAEKYQFSQYGVEKLIKFINDSNNSYLMLSGGGEPMVRKDIVNEIVREVVTDRIVVVTSGIWAKSFEGAKNVIDELFESFQKRKNENMVLVLRLSVDSFHYEPLGFDVINNIIKVFRENYSHEKNFQLRIHTMQEDPTLDNVAKMIGGCKVIYSDIESVSDNKEIIKILPKQAKVVFDDGYEIFVGCSKLFFSNLKIDLNKMTNDIQKSLDVFEKDMSASEYGNPSILTNCDGSLGLDFWIDYNGNVTTWGNQQWDSLYNVYVDTYQDLIKGTFENIISYSFLDKGYYYRERIIREVNPRAVLRSKAMNLRDYAGAFLMEEDKTKLYYAVRAIKDYLDDGVLSEDDVSFLPANLLTAIHSSVEEIDNLYKKSDYDIISQYFDKKEDLNEDDWNILFTLIKLGHYDVSEKHIEEALKYYNDTFYAEAKSLEDIPDDDSPIMYGKYHNRISFMKKETENFCLKMMH